MTWKEWIMSSMSERCYNYFFYYYIHLRTGVRPKLLNLKKPDTFNEKTIWLKLHQRYGNASVLADKVLVKDFVRQLIGQEYLIPTIAVFESESEVLSEKLPNAFVLKANHGSGWNLFCRDKQKFDFAVARTTLRRWLATNYYDIGKEYQYRDIHPKILCEEYIENTADNPLIDYKVFCFSGVPMFVQVDLDRFTNHTRNFYDLKWERLPFTTLFPLGQRRIERPERLDEMLWIATEISRGLKFARVDLYFYKGSVYFGEITLHHGGGFEPFIPVKYDRELGRFLNV